MRKLWPVLILAFATSARARKEATAVIRIDEAHNHAFGDESAGIYQIAPCKELVIDASGMRFQIPKELAGKKIDTLMVAIDKEHQYRLSWDEREPRKLVSKATASGGPAFDGVKAGQRFVVAFGHLDESGFGVVWAGIVDVRVPR